ncbi:MAG: hypothetical protein AB7O95_03255 [Geminicoccaceae bacterium]
MSPVRLFIGTPAYGGRVTVDYTTSLAATLLTMDAAGISGEWSLGDYGALIGAARNRICAEFLASDCSHALFVDADISWKPAAVLRLIEHDLPVVGALARVKGDNAGFDYLRLSGASPDERGLLEVTTIGASFVLVRRDALQTLIETGRAAKVEASTGMYVMPAALRPWLYDFWPSGLVQGRYLSEDTGFCVLWKQAGGRIFADLSIQLRHHGARVFDGDPMAAFALEPCTGEAA